MGRSFRAWMIGLGLVLLLPEVCKAIPEEEDRYHPLIGGYSWSPDGGKIAFCPTLLDPEFETRIKQDGTYIPIENEIYVIDVRTKRIQRLTNTPAIKGCHPGMKVFNPVWSPDGGKIAFEREEGEDLLNIWVMNADGTDQRRLTKEGGVNPVWSPDGSKIAYEHGEDIWVMNADGTHKRRLTRRGGYNPVWSPDGTKIAFQREDNIWVMDADGGNQRQLTTEGNIWNPLWSPDGSFIIYLYSPDGYATCGMLLRRDLDKGYSFKIGEEAGFSDFFREASFSPDGSKIAVNVYLEGYLFVMNPDGSGVTDISPRFGHGSHWELRYPQWSPTGDKIAFLATEYTGPSYDDIGMTNFYIINPDGTGLEQITYFVYSKRARVPEEEEIAEEEVERENLLSKALPGIAGGLVLLALSYLFLKFYKEL